MSRKPCCSREELNRGAWTAEEDRILRAYIKAHGEGRWRALPKKAGLKRCGKSCRLRWLNYLRPDIKRGNITHDEEDLIIRLHKLLGNKWSLIAGRLPGRTDNEIKNYWNTYLRKKVQAEHRPGAEAVQPIAEPMNHLVRTKAVRRTNIGQSIGHGAVVEHGAVQELVNTKSTEPEPREENWWDFLMSLDTRDGTSPTEALDFNFVEDWNDKSLASLMNCDEWLGGF